MQKMKTVPESIRLAQAGLNDIDDLNRLLSATMCDVLTGDISVQTANRINKFAGKVLKEVEHRCRKHAKKMPPTPLKMRLND